MKRLMPVLAAFLAALMSSAAPAQAPAHRPGHLLVSFAPGTSADDQMDAMRSIGGAKADRIGHLRWQRVRLFTGQDPSQALSRARKHWAVDGAELDRLAPHGSVTPDDPGYGSQWALTNISCPTAWDITTGDSSVVVAVLDSGCDPTHADLTPNYVAGWNVINLNTDTHDVAGHGTAVAGCVGARGNNGIGVASPCWIGKVMPVRIASLVSGQPYAYWSDVATGMQWAVDHGAKIENCSYVGLAGSSTIQSAASYVVSKGGIFVACAGNDSADPGFAQNPNIVIVSGTDQSNARASFSDFGAFVTVSAPAVSMYTTTNGGGYGTWQGTSFAAPTVCGVLALCLAAQPGLTPSQLRDILVNHSDDLGAAGYDTTFGYGKVNAYEAVTAAQGTTPGPPPDTTAPTCSITSPADGSFVDTKPFTITVSASDNIAVVKVELYLDGQNKGTDTGSPWSFNLNPRKWSKGTHTLLVKAYDAAGNAGTSSSVTLSK